MILKFVNERVPKQEAKEGKSQWRKCDVQARRILVDSVKDHMVPQILEKKTTRNMFQDLEEVI